jgi:hypothetical protein
MVAVRYLSDIGELADTEPLSGGHRMPPMHQRPSNTIG